MMISEKLLSLGLVLPKPASSVANYVPYTISSQGLVIISGQLPMENGAVLYTGKVGRDVDLKTGQDAARLCALNILAQLEQACQGHWTRVKGCLRLGGFVQCCDTFTEHSKIMNGASDLIVEVFGPEIGRHARAAVGMNALPLNAAVEVEALFELTEF